MENQCKKCRIKKTETAGALGKISEGSLRYECIIPLSDIIKRTQIKNAFEQRANKIIGGGSDCPQAGSHGAEH